MHFFSLITRFLSTGLAAFLANKSLLVLPAIPVAYAVDPRILTSGTSNMDASVLSVHSKRRTHISRPRAMEATKRDATNDTNSTLDINGAANVEIDLSGIVGDIVHVVDNLLSLPTSESAAKLVVAHHMVGNAYPYTLDDWKRDINLASSHYIDGFALNIGRDEWMGERVADAYSAAQLSGTNFKLFLSLDMTSLPCATPADIQALEQWVLRFAHHPNQLIYKGKPLVSTFAGEGCSCGGSFAAAWTLFKNVMQGNVHFVPSLFVDPGILSTMPFLDGIFNWNGGWPTQLNDQSSARQIAEAVTSLNTDASYLAGVIDNTYIAPVSPWFFTHYGPDTWNKNWIYRGDDWLYSTRWEELINMRDRVDIVEIISWNDYGESHYIGPIAGAQPNSQAWVDGFDHQGWLELSSYYAQAFKTGFLPQITEDKVFLWARPHPKNAHAPDHVPRPQYADLTEDFFWAVVLSKSPATAVLYTPDHNSGAVDSSAITVEIAAGVSKLRHPLVTGRTMAIRLERGGAPILDYRADGFTFDPNPKVYNFNAWVGWTVGTE